MSARTINLAKAEEMVKKGNIVITQVWVEVYEKFTNSTNITTYSSYYVPGTFSDDGEIMAVCVQCVSVCRCV